MGQAASRRSFLGLAAAAAACPLCASPVLAEAPRHGAGAAHGGTPGSHPHWGYTGSGGPPEWGGLSANFSRCSLGTEQAPIDLIGAIKAQAGPIGFAYEKMPLTIVNNGHTIAVLASPGSRLHIGDTDYELVQFHFHHPSEHLLAGKAFDLEVHFVHRAAHGGLAVVGLFVQPGATNAALAPIWDAMPAREAAARPVSGVVIDPGMLLPQDRRYFRYMGSLTTPPCSEGLTWTVFRSPIEASPEQIRRFAALFPMNARPPQPLNRRFLLES